MSLTTASTPASCIDRPRYNVGVSFNFISTRFSQILLDSKPATHRISEQKFWRLQSATKWLQIHVSRSLHKFGIDMNAIESY